MRTRILVPLDGSPLAEQAIQVASLFARRCTCDMFLAHVHTHAVPVTIGTFPLGDVPVYDETWDRERREQEQAYLDAQAQRLASMTTHPVTEVILDGPIVAALKQYIEDAQIDLVIMTSHGTGGWALSWLGSIAHALLHASPVPVLLVPSVAHDVHPIRRVLVPLDGTADGERLIEPVLGLPVLAEAKYTLLTVVTPMYGPRLPFLAFAAAAAEATEARRDDAEQYLRDIAERWRCHELNVQTLVLLDEQPARRILAYAREGSFDLIAVAAHGRGVVSRLLLGSVADKVVRGSDRPVLVVRRDERPRCA